jgi:hypothetical protein
MKDRNNELIPPLATRIRRTIAQHQFARALVYEKQNDRENAGYYFRGCISYLSQIPVNEKEASDSAYLCKSYFATSLLYEQKQKVRAAKAYCHLALENCSDPDLRASYQSKLIELTEKLLIENRSENAQNAGLPQHEKKSEEQPKQPLLKRPYSFFADKTSNEDNNQPHPKTHKTTKHIDVHATEAQKSIADISACSLNTVQLK